MQPFSPISVDISEKQNKQIGEKDMTAETVIDQPMTTTSDERTWAMIAHLSVLINLFTGILGPVVAIIIYYSYKDKSRYVAYQALQSFLLQLIVWVGGGAIIGVIWVITGLLSLVLVGLCLIPFAIVLSLVPVVAPFYGIYAAVETSQGKDFRYWLIGDWVRGTLVD
jgi:uncharacterized protein